MKIPIEIEIKWRVKYIDGYGFGTDNNLYNTKTFRKIKQCSNNGSIGYWLKDKKFYSLNKLKPLLYKPKKEILPF